MRRLLGIGINTWFVFLLAVALVATTKDMYMLNTGDFHRAIFPFMPPIPSFQHDMSLKYPLYDEFWGISKYTYMSTYSYILYFTAELFKLVTNQLDARVLSALLKVLYLSTLFNLYIKITGKELKAYDLIIFFALSIFMCSSSNIAFFPSFYQEQVLLICLPIMATCLINRNNSLFSAIAFSVAAFVIGGSKSQFFYIPILSLCFVVYFLNYRKTMAAMLVVFQILSIAFVLNSSDATNFNKYHAAYYGVYAYEKMNGIKLPDNVSEKCVGIDAWGGQLDKERGSHRSSLGKSCYQENQSISFMDTIKEYVIHPEIVFQLPFDEIVKDNLVTDYIHVAKTIKVIIDDKHSWSSMVTTLKDEVFGHYRILIMFAIFIVFAAVRNARNYLVPITFVSMVGISQFYISFLGEGYRDLSKHLFGLSFSFDLVVFIAISALIAKLFKKLQ
ncbi:hypothetical protein [Yersinia kristensenii]|uniref:hypothetical protein n=2 Tax=Yersinia kristensenii TaxID=28152 RepID=UPI0005E62C4C|nr:hypothetical protein [Yersinia kristensenii]MDA5477475.1 hypothetical protein [Yersinia kristensenii]MDA5505849.1 hypothetical protein [Yersinia kristensenii]MDA5522632.1 hypothetical protein [Yersinia kristensenii]MDX6735124.1 hypothetical protein [Yersinia kristensenii]NIK96235.1 hypothetical protein [Yersinia kristensenii]